MSFTTLPPAWDSKLSTLKRWLIEPSVSLPPVERRQSRLMMIFLLSLIAACIFYLIFLGVTRIFLDSLGETIAIIFAMIATYFLSRRGHWKLAAFLSIAFIYLTSLVMVINSGDPLNAVGVLPFLILPLLLSSIFFSANGVLYTTIFFSIGIASLPIIAPPVTFVDLLSGIFIFLWITAGIIYISVVHRNKIEAEHRAELLRSESRFRQMAENIHEVFWTYETSGDQIGYASPAYEHILGRPSGAFLENPLAILETVHPEDFEQAKKIIYEIAAGHSVSTEVRVVHPDNSVRWVWGRGFPVFNSQNKVISVAGIISDITERKQAQKELEKLNQTLEERVQERTGELVLANMALDKAAKMKDEFLAGMSHELRTPLTSILGFSEALQLKAYGELNEKQHKTIRTIEESGRHLLDLINDVLDLAKIEAGKLELQFANCSLADICQSSVKLTKGMAQQKGQYVQYSGINEPVMLYADARRIKQALVNLISNAVKFTPEHGELGLDVKADPVEQKIRLSVWDKGIGIKPDDLHKLFKPFTQIDSSLAREYSGTGLGLSLVYRLIESHQGGIELESEFGKGSRFTIVLPWSPKNTTSTSDRAKENSNMQPVSTTFTDKLQTNLILVADDNAMVLQMLVDFLEMQQYRVMKACSGIELLEKVAETPPDIMLVDIQMPRLDGLETIRRIRADGNPLIAAIPVIAVTALAMPGDRERCIHAGANEYVSKPLKLNELTGLIKKYLK